MRKFYLILIILSIYLAGCGTEAANDGNAANDANQNSNANAQNTNGQNANSNTAKTKEPEDEEVPKFEDADEALKKGKEYSDKNKNEMAIDAFKQAVELNPDLADAHFELGIAYALQEREEAAKVKSGDEIEDEKGKKKANKKPKKKNSVVSFENAVKAYKKFLRKNPKDAEAHFNLGRAYAKLGEKKDIDARKSLEKAVKLDDENSFYRTELGDVLIKLAKYPEAIKQLNKAIELQEDNNTAKDLLEKAKAGNKRVKHGVDKAKARAKAKAQSQQK